MVNAPLRILIRIDYISFTVPDPKVVNLSSKASIYAVFRAFLFGENI